MKSKAKVHKTVMCDCPGWGKHPDQKDCKYYQALKESFIFPFCEFYNPPLGRCECEQAIQEALRES